MKLKFFIQLPRETIEVSESTFVEFTTKAIESIEIDNLNTTADNETIPFGYLAIIKL